MSTKVIAATQIAHDALEDLENAKRALSHLESLLKTASTLAAGNKHLQSLMEMGWFYACDAANNASINCEGIGEKLIAASAQFEPTAREQGKAKP